MKGCGMPQYNKLFTPLKPGEELPEPKFDATEWKEIDKERVFSEPYINSIEFSKLCNITIARWQDIRAGKVNPTQVEATKIREVIKEIK